MSQANKLIRVMKRRYITALDALKIADCMSFHRRLTDIERMGYIVTRKPFTTKTGKRIKRYKITGKM